MGPVLVFDSGVGGLSVLRALRTEAPDLPVAYLADNAVFPYGALADEVLTARAVLVIGKAIAILKPACVVIACNTASTLVLPPLRAAFDIPFVGTVPAIKPAAEVTQTRIVSVLATPGTVRRDYTRALIDTYASHIEVTLVGAENLAAQAEKQISGDRTDALTIGKDIAACFVERTLAGGEKARTDTIALACTHYPLLLPILEQIAPWPVTWLDPAPAIARRVLDVLGDQTGRVELSDENAGLLLHTGPQLNTRMMSVFSDCAVSRSQRLNT
jgi:glutamate racemase